jgi:hypothetical protein
LYESQQITQRVVYLSVPASDCLTGVKKRRVLFTKFNVLFNLLQFQNIYFVFKLDMGYSWRLVAVYQTIFWGKIALNVLTLVLVVIVLEVQ